MKSSTTLRLFAAAAIGATALALSACASARKAIEFLEDPSRGASAQAPKPYGDGLAKLEAGDPAGALAAFDAFALDQPASPWSQVAAYNAGRALEALEKWSEAALRYRAVAQTTAGKAPRLQALALYRLSFCYDGMGDDGAALAALRDAAARKEHLPAEIAEAEFPARVAGAYARTGNLEAAGAEFAAAERGIARVRARFAGESRESGANALAEGLPEWLPRTLFEMGRASIRKPTWENADSSLRAFRMGQSYLLEAAETGAAPWAARAAFALTSAYGDFLATMDEAAPPAAVEDPVIEHRRRQRRRWDFAAELLGAIGELRARRAPEEPGATVSREATRIMRFLDGAEANLRQSLAERPAGSGLTPEAAARQSRVRGKTKGASDVLEREYAKRGARVRNLPRKKSDPRAETADPFSDRSPERPASSSNDGGSEDPNL